jgi:hypothetical protein
LSLPDEKGQVVLVTSQFVPRTLSFKHDQETAFIDADAALDDPRLVGRPLIVLGEAGSGKSELLGRWGGGRIATANDLLAGLQARRGGRILVDGFDEVAGLKDGGALAQVLGKLEA